ncbi:hypothetical protein D3C81_1425370 [compost metagenome]
MRRGTQAACTAPQEAARLAHLVLALAKQIRQARFSPSIATVECAALFRVEPLPGQRHQSTLGVERVDGAQGGRRAIRHGLILAAGAPPWLAGKHCAIGAHGKRGARHGHAAIGQAQLRLEPVCLFRTAGQRHQGWPRERRRQGSLVGGSKGRAQSRDQGGRIAAGQIMGGPAAVQAPLVQRAARRALERVGVAIRIEKAAIFGRQ